jgi:ribonuclease R
MKKKDQDRPYKKASKKTNKNKKPPILETEKMSLTLEDPFASREAEKYDHPIPSREFILSYLKNAKVPLNYQHIRDALGLDEETQGIALQRRLKAMVRDDQLEKLKGGLYCPVGKRILIEGRVIVERSQRQTQYYVIPDAGGKKIAVDSVGGTVLFSGNRVVISVVESPDQTPQNGKLIEILSQPPLRVTGRFIHESGASFVVPYGREITQDIIVPENRTQGASNGQIVVIELMPQATRWEKPVGQVIEVLGDEHTAGIEIQSSILTYGLPNEWNDELKAEIAKLTETVPEAAKAGRLDLRHLPFVTIDGEDAKDFDDAVYAERKPRGGWHLWVAIADVSAYVKPGSALDKEAMNRGNSVYFPGKVIPMLPEILSNGLCSLRPEVDRLCLVAELSVSKEGVLTRYHFHEAVIHSHARLTYTKVAAILTGSSEQLITQYKKLVPHLQALYQLYQVLREARVKRGAIEFETVETRIVFGKNGKISRIEPIERNEAHRLIEECMLCANVATARFLKKHKMPSLYRNHEGPPIEKLTTLKTFLGELGLKLGGGDEPTPLDYTELLSRIKDRPDANIIQSILLRSLSQAVYSPDNIGHFGLAYPEYCHFTSPIRRYPDLWVHRQIKAVLEQEKKAEKTDKAKRKAQEEALSKIGMHCSTTERRADDATRDAIRWLKCQYIQKHLGAEFEGVISGVVHFGFFVELKSLAIDGLVHINTLADDYYDFDAVRHRLLGERSGKTFKLGDTLKVRVIRADLDTRKIDFELVLDPNEVKLQNHEAFKKSKKGQRNEKQKAGSKVKDKRSKKTKAGTTKKTETAKKSASTKPSRQRRRRRRNAEAKANTKAAE